MVVKDKDKEKESVKVNMRKQGKVCDVTEQGRKPVSQARVVRLAKPVDEDLYKIPPELLRTTKRVSVNSSPNTFTFLFIFFILFNLVV